MPGVAVTASGTWSGRRHRRHAGSVKDLARVGPPDRRHRRGHHPPRRRGDTAGGARARPAGDRCRAGRARHRIPMGQAPPGRRPGTRAYGSPPGGRQPRRDLLRKSCFGTGAIGLGAVLNYTDVLPLSGAGTGAGAAIAGVTVLVAIASSMRELRRAMMFVQESVMTGITGETSAPALAGSATSPLVGEAGHAAQLGRAGFRRLAVVVSCVLAASVLAACSGGGVLPSSPPRPAQPPRCLMPVPRPAPSSRGC